MPTDEKQRLINSSNNDNSVSYYGSTNTEATPLVTQQVEKLPYDAYDNVQPSFFQRLNASLGVVFTTLNTMVGSTLLAIPWGFRESGVALGGIIFVVLGLISYYTCTLVVKSVIEKQQERLEETKHDPSKIVEVDFSEVCVSYLGTWSKYVALATSVVILIGASIAYHMFMQDCLYSILTGILESNGIVVSPEPWYWNQKAAAIYIIMLAFPLVNLKYLTLLIKINAFGIFFILMLLGYIVYACVFAFIHPESTTHVVPREDHLQLFGKDWSHLLGILSLSFFIHNVIASIIKDPTTKPSATRTYSIRTSLRDIAFAYILAGLVYLTPGLLGVLAFRYCDKMQQNFLNQFLNTDIIADIARGAVLLQLYSIFPLLLYVIRVQIFGVLVGNIWPNFLVVVTLNLIICIITTVFALFVPQVGTVLRYTGAFCGLIYLYLLPIGVHMIGLYKKKQLRWYSVIFHFMLLLLGAATLVLQFINF